MRIILQFPEGLKTKAMEEAAKLEAEGHEVFVACAPCYGACDLCLDEARHVKAEKLIHFGHAEFMKIKMRGVSIEYLPALAAFDEKKSTAALNKAIKLLPPSGRLSLVFPIQQLENSKFAKKFLENKGFTVLIGKGGTCTNNVEMAREEFRIIPLHEILTNCGESPIIKIH